MRWRIRPLEERQRNREAKILRIIHMDAEIKIEIGHSDSEPGIKIFKEWWGG